MGNNLVTDRQQVDASVLEQAGNNPLRTHPVDKCSAGCHKLCVFKRLCIHNVFFKKQKSVGKIRVKVFNKWK